MKVHASDKKLNLRLCIFERSLCMKKLKGNNKSINVKFFNFWPPHPTV